MSAGSAGSAGEPARGQPPRAQRQRHRRVRLLVQAVRDLQRSPADVEDQQLARRPAEPATGGQERQPGLLRTRQHLELDTGLGLHPGQYVVRIAGLTHGGGGERQHRLDTLVLGGLQRVLDRLDEFVDTVGADRPALVEQLGEPQFGLVRVRGQRARAGVCVHHQQMHRVRTHVEDTESHVRNATAAGPARRPRSGLRRLTLDACQRRKRRSLTIRPRVLRRRRPPSPRNPRRRRR